MIVILLFRLSCLLFQTHFVEGRRCELDIRARLHSPAHGSHLTISLFPLSSIVSHLITLLNKDQTKMSNIFFQAVINAHDALVPILIKVAIRIMIMIIYITIMIMIIYFINIYSPNIQQNFADMEVLQGGADLDTFINKTKFVSNIILMNKLIYIINL